MVPHNNSPCVAPEHFFILTRISADHYVRQGDFPLVTQISHRLCLGCPEWKDIKILAQGIDEIIPYFFCLKRLVYLYDHFRVLLRIDVIADFEPGLGFRLLDLSHIKFFKLIFDQAGIPFVCQVLLPAFVRRKMGAVEYFSAHGTDDYIRYGHFVFLQGIESHFKGASCCHSPTDQVLIGFKKIQQFFKG